jgi:O-antigen ligase
MSNPAQPTHQEDEPQPKSPNLILLYALLALGLLGAMAVAAMIVWPFYQHR